MELFTSRAIDPGLCSVHGGVGIENSERRVRQLAGAYSHEVRADIYGFRKRDRLYRLALDEWLRSSRSVCASIALPNMTPITYALEGDIGSGKKF